MIPTADVNVATDVAYCRACNLAHALSALAHGTTLDQNVDLGRPPAGAWYRSEGTRQVIGATNRSLGGAIGLLLVALFWNGIVSVFVLVTIAATMHNLGITPPFWFPAPKMNGGEMGVGMTLFLWIFLSPFIAVGLGMIAMFFACLAGRSEVRINGGDGAVFHGIGPIGWQKSFETSSVKDVRIDDRQWRDSDGDRQRKTNIVIETASGKLITLGSMFTDERRTFVAAAVRRTLTRR